MKAMLLTKTMLLTSAALLLTSPALAADKMVSNPLTPSEYQARVQTLDEKYAQKEKELAALESEYQQRVLTLNEKYAALEAALESRITRAREELTETLNKNNSRNIQAGLPAEIDSAPQKVLLHMERGTVRVWPAPRPFSSVIVSSNVLGAKPGRFGNADLEISAQEEGSGNIILTDQQGKVIADIQVRVRDPVPRKDKMKRVPLQDLMVEVPPSNGDG